MKQDKEEMNVFCGRIPSVFWGIRIFIFQP